MEPAPIPEQQTLKFATRSGDPVAAYLASGLTALNEDQITIVELVSGLVAGFCSAAGVLVHQPVLHTHPKDHGDLTPAEVHDEDFRKVIESDVVIAVGDFASWGAGKELAWAERLRTPILVLLREGRGLSRLVAGTSADIEIARWRNHDDIREGWTTYFVKRKAQLEDRQWLRSARHRLWAPSLVTIRATLNQLEESDRREIAAISRLTERRISEILLSPLTLAHASLDEAQALVNALELPSSTIAPGGHPPGLPPRSLSALATAAELEGWDGQQVVSLLQRATTELARGGTRRLVFNEPAAWIDFSRG